MIHKMGSGSKSTRSLRSRRRRLAGSLPDISGLIGASVMTQGRRCGKEGCRCVTGELHGPYTYVVLPRAGGRTRTVYVRAAAVEVVQRGVEVSTEVRAVLEEISAINIELLSRGELV